MLDVWFAPCYMFGCNLNTFLTTICMLFFGHNLALKRRINFSGYILNIPYKCGDQTKSNGSARLTANIKPNQTRIYRLQYS